MIEPIKPNSCADLPTSEFIEHKCDQGHLTWRPRRVTSKDHKCQQCLRIVFKANNK